MAYDLAAPESGRSAGIVVRYLLGGLPGSPSWLSVAVGWVSVAAIADQTRRKAGATAHPRR